MDRTLKTSGASAGEEFAAAETELIERVCLALRARAESLGVDASAVPLGASGAQAVRSTDPFDASESLCVTWRDHTGRDRLGSLQIHQDGSFYAEYDILKEHPSEPGCFIEAVECWGKGVRLVSDARLVRD